MAGHFLGGRVRVAMALALGSTAIVAGLARLDFVRVIELQGFDRLVMGQGEPGRIAEIAFVDISDRTVKDLGRWPIPRDTLAAAVDRIAAGAPQLIGLDVILPERRDPAQDSALAGALERAGNVILVTSRTEGGIWEDPRPEFRDAALDVAAASLYLDEDGAVRRVPLVAGEKDRKVLGLAAALYTNYRQVALRPMRRGVVRLGARELRVDDDSGIPSVLIDSWHVPGLQVDLLDVLAPGFDAAVFQGKVVILGESSHAGKDRFATSLYQGRGLVSGPEIHAAALGVLLNGRGTHVLGTWRVAGICLGAALMALLIVMYGRPMWAVPGVLALALSAGGLAFWLLAARQIWLRFVSIELTLLLAVSAGLAYRYLHGDQQERKLRELFGRYVSPDVLREVLRHPEGVVVEGQERTASVLFADIRGFTSTTAGQPPREVVAWVNEYFAAMSEVIERHGGFLNKFIGDGLMVVFGVPVSEGPERDAVRAVRAGLGMLARLEELNRGNAARVSQGLWRPPIGIGIGIHTGTLAAGSVGAPRRMEYSVMGEAVNLAARLESATRQFEGVDLVISEATEALVRDAFVTERLGAAVAKGFRGDVQVYTVRGVKSGSEGGSR